MIPSKIVSSAGAFLLSAFVAISAFSATESEISAPHCVKPEPPSRVTSLGLTVEYLLPNDVAGFPSSLVGYGLSFEVPLGPVLWRLDGAHAAVTNFSMAYGTLSVKVPLETPYLTAFVQAGGHYLAYWGLAEKGSQWGGLLGIGLSTPLSRSLRFEGTLKGYLQGQSLLAIAIGVRTPL